MLGGYLTINSVPKFFGSNEYKFLKKNKKYKLYWILLLFFLNLISYYYYQNASQKPYVLITILSLIISYYAIWAVLWMTYHQTIQSE